MKHLILVIITFAIGIPSFAHARKLIHYATDLPAETGPSLNSGDRIEVDSYDPSTKTYHLILLDDETAGPLVAAPEDLAKSVSSIVLNDILKAPYSIVHFQYSVDEGKELKLLTDEEIARRRK